MAAINLIARLQTVDITIPAGAAMGSATLSSFVTQAQMVPAFWSTEVANGESPILAATTEVKLDITNLVTVTAERHANHGTFALVVTVVVIEWVAGVNVYKGVGAMTDAQTSPTSPPSIGGTVDLAHTWGQMSWLCEGEAAPGNDSDPDGRLIEFWLTTTTVDFGRGAAKGECEGNWWLVEHVDFNVQHVVFSGSTPTALVHDVTIPIPVVMHQTFVVSTHQVSTGAEVFNRRGVRPVMLYSPTALRYLCGYTPSITISIRAMVVSMVACNVQRSVPILTELDAQSTTDSRKIADVTQSTSAAKLGSGYPGAGNGTEFSNGSLNRYYGRVWLSADDTISRVSGQATTSEMDMPWEVVDFFDEVPTKLDALFTGTGPLVGFATAKGDAVPVVGRVNGRYRAELTDNTNNKSLHFGNDQGRLDSRLIEFPFTCVLLNAGIGTLADSQVAPSPDGANFQFCGLQVHDINFEIRNSEHCVIGHRGGSDFTVEAKSTMNGISTVNDAGLNVVPLARGDIMVVGSANGTVKWYWREPGDPIWILYRNTGNAQAPHQSFGTHANVGIITYAADTVPEFVGTVDSMHSVGRSVAANQAPLMMMGSL